MKLFLMCILAISCSNLFAQVSPVFPYKHYKGKDSIYTRALSYQDDRNLYEDILRFNRKYRYVLTGVNRFVFKETTAEQKGENFNTERPSMLQGIKLPTAISRPAKRLPETQGMVAEKANLCDCQPADTLIKYDKELNAALLVLQQQETSFNDKVELFATHQGINRGLEKMKQDLRLSWNNIAAGKIKLLKDSLKIDVPVDDHTSLIESQYKQLYTEAKTAVAGEIAPNVGKLTLGLEEYITRYEKCLFDKRRVLRCLDSCKDKSFRALENKYLALFECLSDLKQYSNELSDYLKKAKASVGTMETAFVEGKIDEVQRNYNLLAQRNFELELDAFVADKDLHEITFTAGAGGPLPFGEQAKRTIKIKARTLGGLKIDYSTGAFYNWGSNNFLGPDYYYDTPTDSTKIIREGERTHNGLLSVGALMHISSRFNSYVRPALSLGVSTTSGFDALNFHAGFSLILGRPGKSNRIILSGGFTFKESSLLNNRYSLNVEGKDYPDAVPVSKNFPVRGGFISLTYNLTGVNK